MSSTGKIQKTFPNNYKRIRGSLIAKMIGNIILAIVFIMPLIIVPFFDEASTFTAFLLSILSLISFFMLMWNIRNLFLSLKIAYTSASKNTVVSLDSVSFGNKEIKYSDIRFVKIHDNSFSRKGLISIFAKTYKISVYIPHDSIDEFIKYLNSYTTDYDIIIYGKSMETSFIKNRVGVSLKGNHRLKVAIWLRVALYFVLFMITTDEYFVLLLYLIEGIIMPLTLLYVELSYYKTPLPTQGIITFKDNFLTFNNKIIYYSNIKDCSLKANNLLTVTLNDNSEIVFPTDLTLYDKHKYKPYFTESILKGVEKLMNSKLGKTTNAEVDNNVEIDEVEKETIQEDNNDINTLNDMLSRD